MGRSGTSPAARGIDGLPASVRAAEAGIANNDFETGIVFDADGNEVLRIVGTNSVNLTEARERKVLKDAIFTHNHPNSNGIAHSGNTFSSGDWIQAVANDMAVMRAVTPTHEFQIVRPARGWPTTELIVDVYQSYETGMKQRFTARVNSERRAGRSPDLSRIAGEVAHESAQAVADKYGIAYTRTPRRR